MSALPLVPDASIIVKLFLEEADTAAARTLMDARRVMVAPELLALETASALIRRFRQGSITRSEAERALESARSYFQGGAVTLLPDGEHMERAETIALDIRHALNDCLYLAVAEQARAELITADATLLARAQPHFPFVSAL